ncbi:hypothetical protein HPP92_029002 [Vanilla planifolia]|uniref:Uncharacterized protein n=1 Tax=Vanilla planifolia TaxID=51239 RepID=A0A835U1M5_VANPL|nr:hypothetical protein HPP92_029002 [Vanilla planifolia]KAG0446124.1 hypothetical protein HPP92_028990 [Vanilla planifolia]
MAASFPPGEPPSHTRHARFWYDAITIHTFFSNLSPPFTKHIISLSSVSHVVVPLFPYKYLSTRHPPAEALTCVTLSNNLTSQEGNVSEGGMRKEKSVVVKTVENPRLVLKSIWMWRRALVGVSSTR